MKMSKKKETMSLKTIEVVSEWENSQIVIASTLPVILFQEPDKTSSTHGIVKDTQIILKLDEAKKLVEILSLAIINYESIDIVARNYKDD